MRRRRIIAGLLLSLVVAPLAAEAQQPGKVPRLGFLWTSSPAMASHYLDAFRQGLRDHGYIEGQNVAIEHRWAADAVERLPGLAAELVSARVDIIVTQGTPAVREAKRATTRIPIVMATSGDPVGTGLVASLARPGGNITGLALLGPQANAKRLELLREIIPRATRVAVLLDPDNRDSGGGPLGLKETESAARSLGLQLQLLAVRRPTDFETAFEAATRARAEALIVLASPVLNFHRQRLVSLAAKHRLPATYQAREFVEDGGLMAYGPSAADLPRRAAAYVDKILKGAKPGDLPIEEPTKFELFINMKTTKALGLTIPPALLQRADQVIE